MQPEYVKKIWSTNIVKIFQLEISATDLYQLRFDVEADLGNKALDKGYDAEITYDDIIKEIHKKLNVSIPIDTFLSKCKKEEIDIESNVLYPNNDIIKQIKEQKKNKCKIYCVSDMYLTKEMISSIFEKLGIANLFDNIFVSSEYKVNKRSGKLYDVVLKEIKAKNEDCIMYGDNKDKDCDMPLSKNIQAEHIDRSDLYKQYEEFLANNTPEKVNEDLWAISKEKNENFNNMIFSLFNFIDKLYFKLKSDDYHEVFFLAREGEYLKKLFDYYVENTYNEKIKSHYLYVSRKSTYLPSLKPIEKEDFSYLLNQYSYVTVEEFLKSLNLPKEDIALLENDLKDVFAFDYKISNFKESIEYRVLKKSSVFREVYEKNRKEQKELFNKYIRQHSDSKRIMIVDIGWNGSIQDNIQNILGDSYDVSGCYFRLCLRDMKYSGKKYGLIFSNDPFENKQYRLYYENRTLYEIMCGASHGSANKYVLNSKKIVETLLFSKKEEQDIFKNIVKPAQEIMFDRFKNIVNSVCNKFYNNLEVEKIFNEIQFNMLYYPSKEQLEFFDKIYHYENFGVFEFTTFNNKNGIGFKKWVKEHIKFFIHYGSYFNDAFWPVLKLYNNNMYIPYIIYRNRRKKRYKNYGLF